MLEQIFTLMVAAHKSDSAEGFAAAHPYPVFVVEPFNRDEGAKFRTTAGAAGLGTHTALARVRKREGANAFGMMITIGRAGNNDIQLPAPDVSKFHAYLMRDDGRWQLTDAGSTYGTLVEGRRLTPRDERVPLASGARVQLGSVSMVFYEGRELYDYLRRAEED